MTYRFKVCELVSGKVLDEVPFDIEGDLTRYLQQYGEGTLSLPLFDTYGDLVLETWEQAILPWRSLILVVDEQDRILWHGIPQDRPRTLAPQTRYPCRTIEAYLIRRYVPSKVFKGADQTSEIFRWLAGVAGGAIGLEYDCPPSGILRDREYKDADNGRVYDRINELAAVENGFSWTVDIAWGDDAHTFVRKIARTGYPYLGNRTENPVHVFELGQNIDDFEYSEPWGEGDAATHFQGIGETDDDDQRLLSAPVIDTVREAAGWPRLEERRTFAGVSKRLTLDSHSRRTAAQLFGGQHVLTLEARNPGDDEDFTAVGDLSLGDTAKAIIHCPTLDLEETWPIVGWILTPGTGAYKPVLAKIGD